MSDSTPRLSPAPANEGVARAVQHAAAQLEDRDATRLLRALAEAVKEHGVTACEQAIDMTVIATAKGKSARNLAAALEMIKHGTEANLFISVDPRAERFPVSVRSTGDLGLSELLGNGRRAG